MLTYKISWTYELKLKADDEDEAMNHFRVNLEDIVSSGYIEEHSNVKIEAIKGEANNGKHESKQTGARS